jgi:hypothetical protein
MIFAGLKLLRDMLQAIDSIDGKLADAYPTVT